MLQSQLYGKHLSLKIKILFGQQFQNEIHCAYICKISAAFLQVVGNLTRICYVDLTWPGSANDAQVYMNSHFKKWVDRLRTFQVIGDSAYPLGKNLIKPFTVQEAEMDPRKDLYNKGLCASSTVLTGNLFVR